MCVRKRGKIPGVFGVFVSMKRDDQEMFAVCPFDC